jgi:Protein phosphatase 2C
MMSPVSWTWAAARSTGTSHIKAEKGCEDFGACVAVRYNSDTTLIAVVSDGAGSARYSAVGSWITSRVFTECANRFVRGGRAIQALTLESVRNWIDDIRDRIATAARKREAVPRDFAATLVGSLIGETHAAFIHVGDGGSVYRGPPSNSWTVGTWPAQGEYASTTHFVTDDPEPAIQFCHVEQRIDELAIFSDGLERLVLDFSNHCAFSPFFDRMFLPLSRATPGRNRSLSRGLRRYLDSAPVCERTDDDKSFILAKRM